MNEAVFKTTVMGGFNKSDVLAFIDKQDAQFKEREKDLASRVDSLDTGLKNETQRSAQLSERVAELENQLEAEKNKCAQLIQSSQESRVEAARVKIGLEEEIERRDAETVKLKEEACELARKANEAQARQAEAEARAKMLEDKLNLIDKTEDQIGRAMLEAQQTADKIVTSANVDAGNIIAKASEEAENLTAQAIEHIKEINAEAQEKLDVLLNSASDYKKRVTDSRAETTEFFETLDSVFTSMQNDAEDVLNKFTGAFKPQEKETIPEPEEEARKEAAAVKFDFSGDCCKKSD